MLARLREIADAPPPAVGYSGFPFWHALLVEPNSERRSAEVLKRYHLISYLPMFERSVRCKGKAHRKRMCAVIPGMLFIPTDFMEIEFRDVAFDQAKVRGFLRKTGGLPALISKADIEMIRVMEAKCNLPSGAVSDSLGNALKIGLNVRFTNDLYDNIWGQGVVVEVASEHRIGIEITRLFGRTTKVFVPASEIEAM